MRKYFKSDQFKSRTDHTLTGFVIILASHSQRSHCEVEDVFSPPVPRNRPDES